MIPKSLAREYSERMVSLSIIAVTLPGLLVVVGRLVVVVVVALVVDVVVV